MQTDRRQILTLGAVTVPGVILSAQPFSTKGNGHAEFTDLATKNSATIRRQNEALNKGDIHTAVAFFAERTRNLGIPIGRMGLVRVLMDIRTTFPDWKEEIQDIAAIGDEVIVRVIVTGTHKGVGKIPVNGGLLVNVQPTGKSFKVQNMHWYTLKNGLIVEHRASRDNFGMMQQLGIVPTA